ncbi:ArsR family transcriptional regulator [Candidatus Thorarchaeota archaeon]|nr:MAG: ArsR family transcriptional regulator [Candidatus Thorarchaeota archaeon]
MYMVIVVSTKHSRSRIALNFEEADLSSVVTIFKALADPSRLRIIAALTEKEDLCVSDIATLLAMSISRVSHHLSLLENLGFMKHKQVGKQVYYKIDDDCIIDIMVRAQEHVRGE